MQVSYRFFYIKMNQGLKFNTEWFFSGQFLRKGLILCLFLLILPSLFAQRKPKVILMKERQSLEGKIILINKLLLETASKKQKSRSELSVVNQQLQLRESLIITLEDEIQALDQDILNLEEKICLMEEDLIQIRGNYGRIINSTYRHLHKQNIWLAIFSAGSVKEAFQRMVYFRQFSAYRKNQIALILRTEEEIKSSIRQYEASIQEKSQLIEEKKREMERLEENKSNKIILFTQLRNKENEYRNELELQRLSLKNVLDNLKLDDSPPPPAKNKATGEKGKPQKVGYDPTGKDFAKMKGKLMWPIPAAQAVITEKFGKVKDDFNNDVQNDGITIRTAKGQSIMAVYEGKVAAVMKVPMSGMLVIVSHGEYRTAYTNLTDIAVKPGDYVKSGQVIGNVRLDPRTDESVFQFLIHRPPSYLNPLQWLNK